MGVPDVLADVDPDGGAADHEHGTLGPGLEVPLLVEHAVVRQVHLVVGADHLAVVREGCGIVYVGVRVNEADDHGDASGGPGNLLQAGQVRLDKLRLEQKVFGRVAGDGKLGEGDQVSLKSAGLLDVVDYLAGVPVKVTDGWG